MPSYSRINMARMNLNKLWDWRLLSILVLGAAFRLYNLAAPFSGYHSWKETETAEIALNWILHGGSFLRPTSFVYGTLASSFPLTHYIVYLSWRIFGVSEWAARLPFVILSIASIYLGYLIGKNYSKNIGYLTAFFIAISPFLAYFGRLLQQEPLMIFLMLLSAYWFMEWMRVRGLKYLYLSTIVLMVATLVKFPAIGLALPYAVEVIRYFLEEEKKRASIIAHAAISVLIVLVPAFLWIRYSASFDWTLGPAHFSSISDLVNLSFYTSRAVIIALGVGLPILFVIPFIRTLKDRMSQFLVLWALGCWLFLMAIIPMAGKGNTYYILPLIPPLCIAAAIGFSGLMGSNLKKYAIPLAAIALLFSLPLIYTMYSIEYPYEAVGEYLGARTPEGELVSWIDNPEICYYARRDCMHIEMSDLATFKNVEAEGVIYVPMFPRTYERAPQEFLDYFEENYEVEKTFYGKVNFLKSDNRNKYYFNSEPEWAMIYRHK